MSEKKIYIKSEKRFIDADDELYRTYYQDIWAYRKQLQRSGQCKCPKRKLIYCDADCLECEYYTPTELSLDGYTEDKNASWLDTLTANSDPESEHEKEFLSKEIRAVIEELSLEEQKLCEYLEQGLTYQEICPLIGAKSERSVRFKVKMLRKKLRERLGENFFENF